MSGDLDLEQRYRRVLRLLPGYYRRAWEQDMVAAFLESSLTGDPDEDDWVLEFSKPAWREITSVAALAFRLYLGGHRRPPPVLRLGPGRTARGPHRNPAPGGTGP